MRSVELIFSCIQVSALSYGSWVSFHNQLDTQNAKALMGQCFDAGVNFFDNAEVQFIANTRWMMLISTPFMFNAEHTLSVAPKIIEYMR